MIRFLLLIFPLLSFSQHNTEVFVFDFNFNPEGIEISNFINISTNPGYDNQPSFDFENFILYARNNNGQTDIYQYDCVSKTNTRVNTTTPGGEYSPQRIPNSYDIAAVRLDTSGLQRLYRYDERSGDSSLLIDKLPIAYYTFYDDKTLLSAVIYEDILELVISKVDTQDSTIITRNVGRSIAKVPFSKNMSYTVLNESGNHDLYLLDMESFESYFVCELPIGIEDYTWLDGDRILIGSNSSLFIYDLFGVQEWEKFIDFSEYNISNITRLAVHPTKKRIALVAEINTNN